MKYTFSCEIEMSATLTDTGRIKLADRLRDTVLDWFEHNAHRFVYPSDEQEFLDALNVWKGRVE